MLGGYKTIGEKTKSLLEGDTGLPNKDIIYRGELPIYEKEFEIKNLGESKVITYHARNVNSDYLKTILIEQFANTNIETISSFKETNYLIVKMKSPAKESESLEQMVGLEEVQELIRALDEKAPQIMIQASITRVFADYTDDLRTRISALAKGDDTLPTLDLLLKGADLRSPERLALGGSYGVVGELGSYTLRLTLNELESLGFAEDLASPTLVVSNGETARTSRTQKIPIPREIIVGQSISKVTEYEPIVNFLEVTPNARHGGNIHLELKAGIGAVNPSGPVQIPSITTRETEISGVTLKQGETLVVAGFLDTTNFAIERGVPPFSQVPLIGELFKSHDIEKKRDMVIFLVTPWYIDPSRKEGLEDTQEIKMGPPIQK